MGALRVKLFDPPYFLNNDSMEMSVPRRFYICVPVCACV